MRLVWVIALCLATLTAHAAPEVRVRARTRIVIERVISRADGVAIKGRVVEPATGRGLEEVHVTIVISGEGKPLTTDSDGRFEARFYGLSGKQVLTGEVPGDGTHVETVLPPLPFNVNKPTPEIGLSMPTEIDAGGTLDGAVTVEIDGEPQEVDLQVQVLGDDDQAQTVATLRSNDRGRALISVPASQLGGHGDRRVIVRFPGNDRLNLASAEAAVRIMSTTELADIKAPGDAVSSDENIVIKGKLLDERKAGVEGATVTLRAGGDIIGEATSDDEGAFTIKASASSFAPGPLTLGLEYVSSTTWRRGTRAAPIQINIAPARSVPLRYTLGAVLLTALVVLAFWAAREKPWLRLQAWWRRRRPQRRPGESGALPRQPGEPAPVIKGGLEVGRARMMSGLRRASDDVLAGTVADAVTGRPIEGAMVEAQPATGHAILAAVSNVDGAFALTLPAALWTVTVKSKGYVRETFSVTTPHRGELREVRVTLVPVREQVFLIYRKAALLRLPRQELWGVWTPRELLNHVRQHHASGAMGQLTAVVEEAYFSARTPDEEILPEVERLAQAARIEGPMPGMR